MTKCTFLEYHILRFSIIFQVESAPANNTDVILGGGLLAFKAVANSSSSNKWTCQRSDGRDLIKEWKAKKAAKGQFVSDLQGLKAAKLQKSKNLLGVFSDSHLPWDYERPASVPSLSDMTETAIEMLHRDHPGFFLMVEGGRIDHAHHFAQGKIALDETLALDQAVQKALDTLAKLGIKEETLVIVTADHGHTMTLPGYPARGADLGGFLGINEVDGSLETPIGNDFTFLKSTIHWGKNTNLSTNSYFEHGNFQKIILCKSYF